MKFQVAVSKNIVEAMFDSETEINILLYLMILKLRLTIKSNVMIHMRNISNKSLHVIEYIFKVEIQPATLFLELFVFWHVIVGTKLFLTLSKV